MPDEVSCRYWSSVSTPSRSTCSSGPEQATPWPSIHGIMHGHVAADGSGKFAEIDEQGRYKVSLPFDSGNAHNGARRGRNAVDPAWPSRTAGSQGTGRTNRSTRAWRCC